MNIKDFGILIKKPDSELRPLDIEKDEDALSQMKSESIESPISKSIFSLFYDIFCLHRYIRFRTTKFNDK